MKRETVSTGSVTPAFAGESTIPVEPSVINHLTTRQHTQQTTACLDDRFGR